MKVEKATINLVLRKNKTLSNGNHPIMLRINWGGKRAEKSTGYSCKKSEWNERTSLLKEGKGGVNNARQINVILSEMVKKAEAIRNDFILKEKPYSAKEIIRLLDDEAAGNKLVVELHEFSLEYQKNKHLRLETIGSINNSIKCFTRFIDKNTIYLSEISKTVVESFGRWMKNEGYKTNTIIVNLRNLSALFTYAVEIGVVKESPFKNFTISKKYQQETHVQPIAKDTLQIFKHFYMNYIATKGGDELIAKESMRLSSKLFAMNAFLMSYELQGLAMVDMAHLTSKEVKDFQFSQGGNGYLVIVTHRRKTGKEVRIVLSSDPLNYLLFLPYLKLMEDTDYLLPIFRREDDTEAKRLSRIRYATEWVNRRLHGHGKVGGYKPYVGIWHEYNDWLTDIVEKNTLHLGNGVVVTKDNVTNYLIDEDTTFYAARHTFASNFINSEGATAGELATLLGRNVAGIDRYIRELQSVQDIISAREKMK